MQKILIVISLLMAGISIGNIPEFMERRNLGEVENNSIDEASGLAASKINPGILWTHNDSGDENRIFAVALNGGNVGVFYIDGAENRDWEDMEIGSGPVEGKEYIYIADIGDNEAKYEEKYIYRIEEPKIPENHSGIIDTLINVSKITFTYPDGNRDSETLLFDPLTKDIFLLSKRDSDIRLYSLRYPQSISEVITAELVDVLNFPDDPEINKPYNYITSGDISNDGSEIIIKTYSNIYYWLRDPEESVTATLSSKQPAYLPFARSVDETQGEAVCWNSSENKGYFTLAEEKIFVNNTEFNFPAQLYYYERIQPNDLEIDEIIRDFKLNQNFPNPFNPETIIEYDLPYARFVESTVYDKTGEKIADLVEQYQNAGHYKVKFDASSLDVKLSSGIYFYRINFGGEIETKSMVFIK